MQTIKSSTDLRNNYNDISTLCHTYNEPIFITRKGRGDLAEIGVESYEQMTVRLYIIVMRERWKL